MLRLRIQGGIFQLHKSSWHDAQLGDTGTDYSVTVNSIFFKHNECPNFPLFSFIQILVLEKCRFHFHWERVTSIFWNSIPLWELAARSRPEFTCWLFPVMSGRTVGIDPWMDSHQYPLKKGRAVAQRLNTDFPPRRQGFVYGQHVGFLVDKAALGQVFSEYFGFPCQSFHRFLHYYNRPGLTQ
jgi:hypothetical protein